MERDTEILAKLESLDNGKAVGLAQAADVPMAWGTIRYYGGWADKITGKTIDLNPDHLIYTRPEPVRCSTGPPLPVSFRLTWISRSVYAARSSLGTSYGS